MAKAEALVHPEQMPRLMQWQGISVREDVLCTNAKGAEKPRLRKRNQRTLERLSTPLQQLLEPGEAVFYCVPAKSPISPLQQLFMSWWAYNLMQTMLVITNRRIFQLKVTRTGTWMRGVRAVRWGDLKAAKASGWLSGQFLLTWAGGAKEKFWGIASGETAKLKALTAALLPASAGEQTGAVGMISLCPDCRSPLTPRVYQCPACGLVFKNERKLLIMGVFVPGGVYFYVGHPALGVVTAILELFLLLETLGCVIGVFMNIGKPDFGDFVAAAIYFFILLALETLLALSHGRMFVRAFIPTGERRAPQAVSSSSTASAPLR